MVEIDKACQAVLRRHFPKARGFADIKNVDGRKLEGIDIVVGGFPCQDVSVAGKRAGLAGERTGLFFEAVRIINETQPRYVVLENVPGLLSSNDGRDMGTVLGTLEELGYGLAYRVLDAQYFGVAQRRRRVFIVASLGDWIGPREVLFDGESMSGNLEPANKAWKDFAAVAVSGDQSGSVFAPRIAHQRTSVQGGVSAKEQETTFVVTGTITSNWSKGAGNTQVESGILVPVYAIRTAQTSSNGWGINEDGTAYTLDLASGQAVFDGVRVRRLTPKECERLQGFPDDWTADEKDTHRYRQLGNAVAVPVVEWIARRLVAWDITNRNTEET